MTTKPKYNRVKSTKQLPNGTVYTLDYPAEAFKQGACSGTDTEFFFPDREIFSRDEKKFYQRICGECPVLNICREWGTVHERWGVWGGQVPMDRARTRQANGWVLNDPSTGADRGVDWK